jgi:hypothetical protein
MDFSYNSKSYVELRYVGYDEEGNRFADITRRIDGDKTEYLPNLLEAFVYFLHGMTFTYVDTIVAQKNSGNISSSEEAE